MSDKPAQPLRNLTDLAVEDEARRMATGTNSRSLEGMMANISAQATKDAQERRSEKDTAKDAK